MDTTDRRILRILQQDARITMTALAERISMSVPAAAAVAFVFVLALRACVLAFGWQIYHPRPRGILSRYLARRQLRRRKNLRERKS